MARPVALVLGRAMRPQGFQLAAQLGGDALQLADALAEGGEGLLDPGRVVLLRRAGSSSGSAAGRSSFQYAETSGLTYRTPPATSGAAANDAAFRRARSDPPLRIPDRAATQSAGPSRRVPARPFWTARRRLELTAPSHLVERLSLRGVELVTVVRGRPCLVEPRA